MTGQGFRRASRFVLAVGFVAVSASMAAPAAAARRRPLFEPSDLEMEDPGMMEVDVQVGLVRSDVPWRVVVPDVEVDVGLSDRVEIDVDGAYAIEGTDDGAISLDHAAPENIWVAVKLGLWDLHDEAAKTAWALGAQLGPKFPVAVGVRGLGYEGLVLFGRTWGESHLVLNLGGLVDPGPAVSSARPMGLEGGIDAEVDFGVAGLSLTGEVGGVRYFSDDENELHATAGITYGPSEQIDISVVGLVGFLAGGDQRAILLGVSPKLPLWR